MPARRDSIGDSNTRDDLLDAAQHVMLADGYAAATTRRVAKEAGVNSALVSYYFGSLDGMFVALFRRGAERNFDRLEAALATDKPLWAFWDLIHDQSISATTMEFIALANHRKAIHDEIAESSRRFRRAQVEALERVLPGYGLDPHQVPASMVVMVMTSVSRFLLMEESFGVGEGHDETRALVEDFIRGVEGERPVG